MKTLTPRLDLHKIIHQVLPPFDFVLPGLIAGTVGVLAAPGGAGKSIFALQAAADVATGADTLGIGIAASGPVLLIAAEDPIPVLGLRLQALMRSLPANAQSLLMSKLDVMPALTLGIDLYSAGVDWLPLLAERGVGCRLIVIDTLSRTHTGDENSRQDAGRVMRHLERLADETGAAVLLLHHVGKASVLNGQGNAQQAVRGASTWVDEARWVAYLHGPSDDDVRALGIVESERRRYIRFGVSKLNYGEPPENCWLKRGAGGLLTQAIASGVKKVLPVKTRSRRHQPLQSQQFPTSGIVRDPNMPLMEQLKQLKTKSTNEPDQDLPAFLQVCRSMP